MSEGTKTILAIVFAFALIGCAGMVADNYAEPKRDEVLIYLRLVDKVYLDGVRVAEKTECKGNVCRVELERETYLDCAAHAVAHAFAGNIHDPDVKTDRQYCRNWRHDG